MSRRRASGLSLGLIGVMVLVVGVGAGMYWAKARKSARVIEPVAVNYAATGPASIQTPLSPPDSPPPTLPLIPPQSPPTTTPTTRGSIRPATTEATSRPTEVGEVVAEGKAKIDAGDLLGGRKILNDALLAGTLSESDQTAAKKVMAGANQVIVFSGRRFPADPFQGTHVVVAGEKMQKIAYSQNVTWEFLLRINGISDPKRMRAGMTLKTIVGPFHAVVNKGAFTMDVWLGSPGKVGGMYVTTLAVGLGREDSTPTGTWMAGDKLKNPAYFSPRGEGVIAADDPKNPLGEFWIGLQGVDGQAVGKMSYGIHGTIDPESIGRQSSMGCIRLRDEDIKLVYELLVGGKSLVVVRD